MDLRLKIAVISPGNVAEFCRQNSVSRETFYLWRRRYLKEGLAGLEPRSRVPHTSPQRVAHDVEDLIVRWRKDLIELGVDAGPTTIHAHLVRQATPGLVVPSPATIWRILVRRGFITPEPRKRPKTSFRRFQASAPNELWQTDSTDWATTTGPVKILSFLDDHSRVALRCQAMATVTSEATWTVFSAATQQWGVPLGQLSDNGLNFSGRLRGFEVHFETQLRAIGVVAKTSRPFHPQTCGKVERFQQTMKKWLRYRDPAPTMNTLQAQIDEFVDYYNHSRPHRALNSRTPIEQWTATPPAINLGIALPSRTQQRTVTIGTNGAIKVGRYRVYVGTTHTGRTATAHFDDTHIAVFIGHQLVRALAIDPTRTYQPKQPT